MRKIFMFALTLGMLSMVSCDDELEQVPYNAVIEEQAFVTESDFTNAIRGAYQALRLDDYYGGQDAGSMIITPDILADNLIINSQGRRSQQNFFLFNYTANDTWQMWSDAYTAILRVNTILDNIDNLEDGEFKENIRAEALAIRGLAHFDLLRTYAERYAGATSEDLGVPYVTTTDPNLLPSRTPLPEAYAMVVDDLQAAESSINKFNGVGRLNLSAVEALLGRVYLYMEEWQNVVDMSTAAIENAPETRDLATLSEFPLIWLDAIEEEVLFKVRILDSDNTPVGVGYGQASPSGVRPEYSPTFELVNLYTEDDVRKDVYIGQTTFNGQQFNYIKKYEGRPSGNANVVDVKVIRLSEVYLNLAEAYFNLGMEAEALAALNKLRSNRYASFDASTANESGQGLYDAILLQRRLELAFEGHRFYDLKRLGLPVERSTSGDAINGSGLPPGVGGIPMGSHLFALPIPQAELDVNPNIEQNEGY